MTPDDTAKLLEENRRLREALGYYADEARWTMNSAGITPAFDDKGHRARQALRPGGGG